MSCKRMTCHYISGAKIFIFHLGVRRNIARQRQLFIVLKSEFILYIDKYKIILYKCAKAKTFPFLFKNLRTRDFASGHV